MVTEIERKALALLNEVRAECGLPPYDIVERKLFFDEALCRAIEQHEAFRQEVSDAVEQHKAVMYLEETTLDRFIIAKPDPLVEAWEEVVNAPDGVDRFLVFCEAIEKRGGKIVWGEKQ